MELLLESGDCRQPVHYRDWLKQLEERGYLVDGKRPDAVFLQIGRSPLVKATTQPAYYRLDLDPGERILAEIAAEKIERANFLRLTRPIRG